MNSTIFLGLAPLASAQRHLQYPIPDRAFAGSSRPVFRWGRDHWRTETSALPQLCWNPTSRLDRPGNIRPAQAMTGFQKSAPVWELFESARGESGAISCCSISFSSRMPEKHVRMTLWPLPNWPAAVAGSEQPEATFAWCPLHAAWSDCCAWDEKDEICANVQRVYANGNPTARRKPRRTAQARRK